MPTFEIKPHSVHPNRTVVEVFADDGALLGTLYAESNQHIRFISKHLVGAVIDNRRPPVVEITLTRQ